MFPKSDKCKKKGKQSPEVYSEEKVAKQINLVKKQLPKQTTGNPDEVGSTTTNTKLHLYKCDQCQFETTNKDLLERHKGIGHRKMFPCGKCDWAGNHGSELRYHEAEQHLNW